MANWPFDPERPASRKVKEAVELNDMEELSIRLTVRQRAFCEEYVVDYDGGKAAIRAGYAKANAKQAANNLMKNKGVRTYIDYLTRSKEAKITAIDPDYVIQQVVTIIGKPGAKDGDRLRGLELLAKHLGMFIDRTELTGKDGGPLEINQKNIEEDAQNFTSLLKQLEERAKREPKGISNVSRTPVESPPAFPNSEDEVKGTESPTSSSRPGDECDEEVQEVPTRSTPEALNGSDEGDRQPQ